MDSKQLCLNVHPMLEAYVQKELEIDLFQQIEQHVTNCPECQAYCQEVEEMNKLLASALVFSNSPANLADKILATVQQQAKTKLKKEFTWVDFLVRTLSYSISTIGLILGIAYVWLFVQLGQERATQILLDLFQLGTSGFQHGAESIWILAEEKWLGLYLFPKTFSSAVQFEPFLRILYQPWLPIAVILSLLWTFIVFYQWIRLIHRFRSAS